MYASRCKASVFRGYVEHKLMNAMEKLTKSMPLFKERNCSVSIVLDSRTRRKNAYEFPLSLRFTIDRKFFYLTVGSSFSEKKFSDICNATKCKSENYKLQKEWKDTFVPKYKYNPQNEMFRLLGTKRSFSQNETFFFSHP